VKANVTNRGNGVPRLFWMNGTVDGSNTQLRSFTADFDSTGLTSFESTYLYGYEVRGIAGSTAGTQDIYGYLVIDKAGASNNFSNVYGMYYDFEHADNKYLIYSTQRDAKINWGGDTNLYSASANVLKTDDKFECANADIGDGTNYTEIKTDGSIEFHGNARTKKSIWIQSESLRAPGTNGATFTDVGISGAWEFADNVTRYVVCKFPLRTDIDRTEDIELVLGWFSPATSGNCKWQLEYLLRGEDEDMTAAAESTETQTVAPSGTANGLVLTTFTVPAANISDTDHCILIRIGRVGGDAADTMSDSAYLSGVCFQFVSDKIGGVMV